MARYTGPVCRLCRREGTKLYLKGERCYSNKCLIDRHPYPPGEHGDARPRKTSEYQGQLREKQKARRIYGVMERQFRRYYARAAKVKGVTGQYLLQLLERRLDNVVYRLGLAVSRPEARTLVRHNHFTVNGKRVNIPSYQIKEGDVVAVAEGSKSSIKFKNLAEGLKQRSAPAWLELEAENLRGRVLRLPLREEIDVPVQERMIIELYSR
ncbi:MAG TPA: 30S ribosomal protein S4 [Bacillota bacterium]|jgi:small subunit ribosomal protein S4